MNKEEFIKGFNDQSEQHIAPSNWGTIVDMSLKRDGDAKKLQIAQEELAKLIQAISKYMRSTQDSNMLVLEELADVTIVLSYVRRICGLNLEDLAKRNASKDLRKWMNFMEWGINYDFSVYCRVH